jgi:hypothetical protein
VSSPDNLRKQNRTELSGEDTSHGLTNRQQKN